MNQNSERDQMIIVSTRHSKKDGTFELLLTKLIKSKKPLWPIINIPKNRDVK